MSSHRDSVSQGVYSYPRFGNSGSFNNNSGFGTNPSPFRVDLAAAATTTAAAAVRGLPLLIRGLLLLLRFRRALLLPPALQRLQGQAAAEAS